MDRVNEGWLPSRTDTPALNRCCAGRLAAIATRLEPLVCNWEVDVVADAIEAVCASTGAIQPRLLRGRRVLGLIHLRPPSSAVAAFEHSVSRSTATAQGLLAEVDVLAALHRRSMPEVRKLVLDLQLEVGTVKKLLSQQLLAAGAAGEAQRDHLAALGTLCRTAQDLVCACQQVLLTWQQLVETMIAHVAPAWTELSTSLLALQELAHDRMTRDSRARLGRARANFETWLETAMGQCQRLQQGTEAAQSAISQLQRHDIERTGQVH